VNADDGRGAEGLCDSGAEEADGAGAEDDNALAGGDVGKAADVDTDGKGLDEGALLERNVVGEGHAEVLGEDVVLGEGAVVGGGGGELHVGAKVVLASLAGRAVAAGNTGLKRNALSGLDGSDLTAGLDNHTSGLVTEDH